MHPITRNSFGLVVACALTLCLAACSRVDTPTTIANARADIAAGKYGEAFVALKNVAQKEPDNATIRVLLAKIAQAQGNPQAADAELSRVALDKIPDAEGQMVKLRVDLAMGRIDAVRDALDGSRLDDQQQSFMRALILRIKGDNEGAIELLKPLAAASKDNIEINTELVLALATTGDMDNAQSRLNEYLQTKPGDPELLTVKARLELAQGRLATAIATLQQAVSSTRGDWAPAQRAQSNFILGDAALRAGELPKAKAALATLEKTAPNMVGTALLKARIAMLDRRPADAIGDLQQIARNAPGDRSVPMMLAEAHLQMRNVVQAQAVLEQLVAAAPEQLDARKLLARLLLQQNRPDKVLEIVEDAPSQQAADPGLRDLQTSARNIQSRATQTVESLRTKLDREPDNHAARLDLAIAQVSSGAAADALQSLARLPNAFEPVKRLRVKLLALVAQSNKRELEKEVDAVIAGKPPQVEQLLTAADVLTAIGRTDLAMRALDVAKTAAPEHQGVALGRASVMLVERRLDDARKEVSALLARSPRNIQAQVAKARIEMEADDFGTARSILVDANKQDPKAGEVSVVLAALELRGGRVPNALAVLQNMVSNAKADGAAAAAAGGMLVNARRYAEALPFLRQALKERNDPNDTLRLARALVSNRQMDEARTLLQALVRQYPANADAVVALAAIETGSGQSQAAIQRLGALSADNKSRIDALVALADAQLAQGQAVEANSNFEKAFRTAPSSALVLRMFTARSRGNIKNPELPLKAWLARFPQEIIVQLALGEHYMRVNDRAAAIATYDNVLQSQPNQPAALNNLAWLLAESEPARAETLARKAVELVPNQPQIAETLATVLAKQGKYAEALPLFASSLKAIATDGGALYRYANALDKAGDKAAAKTMVARALAVPGAYPERPSALALAAALE